MVETIPTKVIEILKRKAATLFSREDKAVIFDAVNYVHDIVTRTTLLIKLYYLENLDDQNIIEISEYLIDTCYKVIQGKKHIQTREVKPKELDKSLNDDERQKAEKKIKDNVEKKKRQNIENSKLFDKLLECYDKYFTPLDTSNVPSVSYILEYSTIQLMTCYKNNIEAHYDKYVKKYLFYYILKKLGYTTCYKAPKNIRKTAYIYQTVLLYGKKIENSESLAYQIDENDLKILKAFLCVQRPDDSFLESHIINNHWKYLKKMVIINQDIETSFQNLDCKKLYSPLILSKSFIPSFIRIDTTAILQLLMNKSRIEEFVEYYKNEYNIILKMSNKQDLAKSFASLTGKKSGEVSDAENFQHATRIWKFLTNMEKNQKYKDVLEHTRGNGEAWVFDNMILTDGYSVCFQITKKEGAKRKVFGENKPKKKTKKELKEIKQNEFYDFTDLPAFLENYKNNKYYVLGDDPGKGNIMTMSNGLKGGIFKYTKAYRDVKTHKKRKTFHSLEARQSPKHTIEDLSIHDFETKEMNVDSKSCVLKTFSTFIKKRNIGNNEMKKLYKRPLFRQNAFDTYCKVKSVDTKTIQRIKTFYNVPEGMELLIFYGNWGRNPNLKNNAPTPGIGIRRKVERYYRTITTPEDHTSKTCPHCKEKSLDNFTLPDRPSECNQRHHLLRCTNENCKRWWHRDVAGSLNILERGLHALLHCVENH